MINMVRRLVAFAVAFMVVGGPVANDICEASCVGHGGHSNRPTVPDSHHRHAAATHAEHDHHSAAEASKVPSSTAVIPVPHMCGHVEAVLTESRDVVRAPAATVMSDFGAEVIKIEPP